ncbi:MAG TPA: asparagine synthase C-terminal domain-containing protein, partial [Flavobacteriaceae bacterium]|nr:asparagine synthase C-terminal domain-containing protein [Flavobacteriaceae bacterium]
NLFFKLTYIPAPHTIYKNIYKLEANRYIEFSVEENKFKIHKTSDLSNFKNEKTSLQKATDQVRNMVMESIESRSISDVPLGTFLSGGVDSSIVSLGLSQIKSSKIDTFSIGFDKASFDETDKSRTVAKLINSNHHEFILTEKDIEASLDEIILNFDEPFADSSALPTYLVSKKTRDHVKVALTGDGGDEVFGGYNKYYIGKLNARYTNYIPKPFHSGIKSLSNFALSTKDDKRGFRFKLKKLLNAIDYDNHFYWNIISLGFIETDNLLNDSFYIENPFSDYQQILNGKAPKTIHDFREIDRHISLEGDMLVKVDRTSMLKSLECRAPFLNKSLWEYTNSLPEEFLMDKWDKKFILKEAFKNEFPEGFLDKSKQGFSVPVGDWLRAHLKPELIKYTSDELLKSQGIFQTNPIKALINNHLSGKEDSSYKVWSYFVFQKWFENTYS